MGVFGGGCGPACLWQRQGVYRKPPQTENTYKCHLYRDSNVSGYPFATLKDPGYLTNVHFRHREDSP